MHRSSESVAAIATALAKAQTELANPEKAMVGTIYTNRSDSPQAFRYASLSAGLDIIRKALGGQQIAIAQTTDIDRANGMVNLTTVLLHTSGEWISSHWPVCPLSETSAPRRMGAALTYARRYSLFTMVGIAGEDDLDAPRLSQDQPNGDKQSTSLSHVAPIGGRPIQVRTGTPAAAIRETLGIEASAAIRAQLIQEIETLRSEDEAKLHAIGILKAKNGLALEDAKLVEAAFSARMALLADPPAPPTVVEPAPAPIDAAPPRVVVKRRPRKTKSPPQIPIEPPVVQPAPHDSEPPRQLARIETPKTARQDLNATGVIKIDKSVLYFSEVRRQRDKPHLRFVALQPCLVCGRAPADPHHLRFAQPRALGRKTSDEFTVPLCRTHHRQNHEVGDERAWWKAVNTDPLPVALRLWRISRGIVDKNS
jgi:hypothetical protein